MGGEKGRRGVGGGGDLGVLSPPRHPWVGRASPKITSFGGLGEGSAPRRRGLGCASTQGHLRSCRPTWFSVGSPAPGS